MKRSMFSVIAALIISVPSAQALESSLTARSSLSPDELWTKIGDFCALTEWDPVVEQCNLSTDGKQRTIVLMGGLGRVAGELEDWDNANRSYSWKGVSGLAPVTNYHAKVSVVADGQTSALKWTASYEAKGVSDAEAHQVIDGAMYRALCIRSPLLCSDDQRTGTPAEKVSFESQSISSTPLNFRGYLRRPDARGPSPAVVLLHGCDGSPETLDQNWGIRIAAWGYVALTIDRFGPRGIKNACAGRNTADMLDAYRALNFLVTQQFVDPNRVVAVGFSQGGLLSLSSVERGPVEQGSVNKFLAAAAFYPPCIGIKWPMTFQP